MKKRRISHKLAVGQDTPEGRYVMQLEVTVPEVFKVFGLAPFFGIA
jgi:hypothetical protein